MRFPAGSHLLVAAAACVLFPARLQPCCAQSAERTGSGVRYVSTDTNGRLMADIRGVSARMLPDGSIEVSGLDMAIYEPDGRTVGVRVSAEKCVYRSEKGLVESDSSVKISGNNVVVSGVGFKWSREDQVVRILSRSRVEMGSGGELNLSLRGVKR